MSDVGISLRGLYKVFGLHPAEAMENVHAGMGKQELLETTGHVLGLRDINLEIAPSHIHVIMGLSGSGKSTLLRHINRLIDPTEGQILVGGRDVTAMNAKELMDLCRYDVSMVFQRFALLPHRTVAENVRFGLKMQGLSRPERREKAQSWIERVGLGGYEDSFPAQLSGGMQQRVGLARALATDADVLLMDEAFSALDPLIRTEMQDVLLALQSELKKTVVFVTHDLDEALRIGDRICILKDGEIVQNGDPQTIVTKPADDYVAAFVKDINRGRVIKLGSIMSPLVNGKDGPTLGAGTILEEAAARLAKSGATKAVVTDDGKPVGQVTLSQILDAAARPPAAPSGVSTMQTVP